MDQPGHIDLMLQPGLQRTAKILKLLIRFIDRLKSHLPAVILQILHEQHRMVSLLLCLHLIPVRKSVQLCLAVVICKIEIQIRRVKFLIHLHVNEFCNFFVQHGNSPFPCSQKTAPRFLPPHW